MARITAFDYPLGFHERRHGPQGYSDYESYREWLRDEFSFRCVFCLRREQWNVRHGTFHLDHFVAQTVDATQECEYDNLLYVCATCNSKKSDLAVPNPMRVDFGRCLRVRPDGVIESLNEDGELLIGLLRLDDPDCTRYRKLMLDTLATLQDHNRATFVEWMRYPDDLPELARKKPPRNQRPGGIAMSWFACRTRGELPETY